MNFNDFTKQALTTESRPAQLGVNPEYLYAGLSLGHEVGQALDILKKSAFYLKPANQVKMIEHLNQIMGLASFLGDYVASINNVTADLDFKVTGEDGAVRRPTAQDYNLRLLHGLLGSFTEASELLTAQVYAIADGKPIDRANIAVEYGDGDWYKAVAFDELGITEDESRNLVLKKLYDKNKGRYKDGTFSVAAAVDNRNVAAESTLTGEQQK